ncbi:MAG TPA: rhodanese-like domain-containing protein [Polyangiaceae bacterium]|nr:rhodanese-like domain-containing protein [Polyangiaceae bacterium]
MTEQGAQEKNVARPWKGLVRDAALTVLLAIVLAAGTNMARAKPLPWIQAEPYEILVPCPEVMGEATELAPDSSLIGDKSTLLFDVRSAKEYAEWHAAGAKNQPFDWLGPPVDAEVRMIAREVARTGAKNVVVYGDGDDPDSGREWARMLAGARLKNIHYVLGGAPALRKAPAKEQVNP